MTWADEAKKEAERLSRLATEERESRLKNERDQEEADQKKKMEPFYSAITSILPEVETALVEIQVNGLVVEGPHEGFLREHLNYMVWSSPHNEQPGNFLEHDGGPCEISNPNPGPDIQCGSVAKYVMWWVITEPSTKENVTVRIGVRTGTKIVKKLFRTVECECEPSAELMVDTSFVRPGEIVGWVKAWLVQVFRSS